MLKKLMSMSVLAISLVMLTSFPVFAQGTETKVGDTFEIKTWGFVGVVNLSPVGDGNVTVYFGDHCRIKSGGTIKIVSKELGKDIKTSRILALYLFDSIVGGTSCPSGTLFTTSLDMVIEFYSNEATNSGYSTRDELIKLFPYLLP